MPNFMKHVVFSADISGRTTSMTRRIYCARTVLYSTSKKEEKQLVEQLSRMQTQDLVYISDAD